MLCGALKLRAWAHAAHGGAVRASCVCLCVASVAWCCTEDSHAHQVARALAPLLPPGAALLALCRRDGVLCAGARGNHRGRVSDRLLHAWLLGQGVDVQRAGCPALPPRAPKPCSRRPGLTVPSRAQPIVSYAHTCSVKLQGINSKTQKAFELVYSTLPGINDMAEAAARVPVERVRDVDSNLDLIADTIKLDLVFPVDEAEGITHVQGMFIFAYELRNRVRLSMETPISIDYSGGVPGSALLVDGHMRLKAANPIQVRAAVRGNAPRNGHRCAASASSRFMC